MEVKETEFSPDKFLRASIQFYLEVARYALLGIKKYWVINCIVLSAFCAIFYFKYQRTETYYQAKSSYVFNYLHKKVYGDQLNDLELLVANREVEEVARILGISLFEAKTILSLKAKNIEGSPLHEDFTPRKVPFYIHIETLDKQSLTSVQKGITAYLQANPFAVEHIKNVMSKAQKQLDRVEVELITLDSLVKQNFEFKDAVELEKVMGIMTQKQTEKANLKEELSRKDSVTLLKSFQAVKVPKARLVKALGIKFLLLAVLTMLGGSAFFYWYLNPKE